MYNEDRKELMDEGYTEAFDACKLIVETRLNEFLGSSSSIQEQSWTQKIIHLIQADMEKL